MNYKKIYLILFFVLSLFLTIGVISAENSTEAFSQDSEQKTLVSDIAIKNELDQTNTKSVSSSAADEKKPVTTKTSTVKKTPVKKIKTKVEAPKVAHIVKKSKYFKVKIENKYDDDIPIKNVKIKVKVYTGKSYKIYTLKTDKRGIAKLNTKNLNVGKHKVVISSADSKYDINKQSQIIIGKSYSAILKTKVNKVLNKKDIVTVKIKNDDDEKEAKVVFKKTPKNSIITKAKFYFKNKYSGKIITKMDYCEFDDGRWELPETDFTKRFSLVKVQVWYIKI